MTRGRPFLALEGREVNSQGWQPLELSRCTTLKPWKGDSRRDLRMRLPPFQGL